MSDDSADGEPVDDDESERWTQTMTHAQLERMRSLCPEGVSDAERVRILVGEALREREETLTPNRLTEAVARAIAEQIRVDEEGRVLVAEGNGDTEDG
jgi:hypothetical protein